MRIVSANITGSLILNNVDVTDYLVSSSNISSSVNSKLNSLQSSTSSLNSFTSSYSTGSFTGSFKGDGSNLYNIPATGVTGLQLDKIASGAVTASVSANGFNVNSNVSITGSIVSSGTSLVSGSSQINITGTTEYSTFSSSISTSIDSLSSSVASTTNTLSSSLSSSIGSLSSSVATTTVGTKNRVDSIEAKTGSYATTGSNTFIGTENITGNLTVTGSVIISSGSAVYNSSLNLTDTSSLTLNSGSNLYVYDSGIISGTFKGSVTGSLGINGNVSITGSIVASGTSLVSGSSQIDITSTTNYTTFSSSVSSSIGNLSSSVATNTSGLSGRITTIEGRGATTGSNIFVGSQIITGSLYVTNDMIVQGCSCLQNITASAVSIGTNTVILNTATPAVRFAGISVQDSGSNAGVTGSILWDGLCNRWVYSNPSGIGYSGGMLISGPRTSTLGSEAPLTCNYIAKSGGGDHIYDSCIIDDGTTVCVNANLKVTGTACFATGVDSCNLFLQVPSTAEVVDILKLNNPAVANSGTRLKFENGYGDLAAIRVTHMDNGSLADDGQIEFQTAQNAVLGTRMTIFNTGISCFACQICAPNIISSGTICSTGNACIGGATVIAGCLGIGTLPTQSGTRLQVAGITDIWSSANTLLRLQHDGTRGIIETFTGGGYSATAINPNGGNVGINTTSPSAKLDVSYISGGEIGVRLVGGGGACAGNMFRSYIGDYSDNSPINLFWANHGNPARTNTLVRIHTNETAAGGYPLRITAQGSLCSPTYEALSINYQGKVGIGTIVGTAALGIGGSGAQTTANLTDGGSRIGIIESIPVGGEAGNGGALVLGSDTWGNGSGRGQIALKSLLVNGSGCGTSDLAFSLRNDPSCSNLTERMRITVEGKVGIGTSTPSAPLTIRCDGSSQTAIMEIATCFQNAYRYVSINAGDGISYCIPGGTSQSPFIGVQGGDGSVGGGSFRIRTGAMGSVSDKLIVTQSGTILSCGRTSSIMASSGNIQEWVGLTGSIANNTGWSLFSITNQYDNLAMDIYVFTDAGSFQTSKHEAVFSYTNNVNSGIGYSSAFCIFRTGTQYNETMTICNLSGANINSQRIAIRVWGYGVGQNGTGGSNLLNTSCLTRIK